MNKKVFLMIAFSLLIISGGLLYGESRDADKGNQTLCPVMENPVNKDIYSDFQGYRVFFCCEGCRAPFEKEPERYLKKMKAKGITPMKLKKQAHCPVSGQAIKADSYVDVNGKRVYVCCDGCKIKVQDNPEKYFRKVAQLGEYLEDLEEGS